MKKTRIIAAVLLSIIILLGVLLYRADTILQQFKPEIMAQLSARLGVKVSAREISVSIIPKPEFSLLGFSIENKNKNGDDLTLEELSLDVSLWPLLKREIEVNSFVMQGMRIPLDIRDGNRIEIAGIAAEDLAGSSNKTEPEAKVTTNTEPNREGSTSRNSVKLSFSKLRVTDTEVILKDSGRKAVYRFSDIDAKLDRAGSDNSFEISMKGYSSIDAESAPNATTLDKYVIQGTFSDEKGQNGIPVFDVNLDILVPEIKSVMSFLPENSKSGLSDLSAIETNLKVSHSTEGEKTLSILNIKGPILFRGETIRIDSRFEDFDILKLKSSINVPELNIEKVLPGISKFVAEDYKGRINQLNCGLNADSLKKLSVESPLKFICSSTPGDIQNVPVHIKKMEGRFSNFTSTDMVVENAELGIGSGNILLAGGLTGSAHLNLSSDISSVQISDIIALLPPEKRDLAVQGEVSSVKATFKGSRNEDGKMENLSGNLSSALSGFTYKNFNLLADLVKEVDAVPGANIFMKEKFPEKYRGILKEQDTILKSLTAEAQLVGEQIKVTSLKAKANGYSISGDGNVGVAGDVNLKLICSLDSELVALLQEKNSKLEKYKEADGTIKLPLKIKKEKEGKPVVFPDAEALLKQQAGAELKEKGKKALDKIQPGLGGLIDGFLR